MTQPAHPSRLIGKVFARLAALGKALLTAVMLALFLMALFLPAPAAYELWKVGEVAQWREVPVRLDAVWQEGPTFGKGLPVWRFRFTDPERGRSYTTSRIEPGQFTFRALGWSSMDAAARAYQAKIGQMIHVRRSPDGRHHYLRAGDWHPMPDF